MISNRKQLMSASEFVGLSSGLFLILTGNMALFGLIASQRLSVLVLPAMLVSGAIFLMLILLVTEYTKVVRAGKSWLQQARNINSKEMAELTAWSPKWVTRLSLALAVLSAIPLFMEGHVSWGPGEPFEKRHLALVISPALFIFISLPVIASARRMPSTYSESLPSASPHDAQQIVAAGRDP